jgi:hypothetical protein
MNKMVLMGLKKKHLYKHRYSKKLQALSACSPSITGNLKESKK